MTKQGHIISDRALELYGEALSIDMQIDDVVLKADGSGTQIPAADFADLKDRGARMWEAYREAAQVEYVTA